MVPIEYDACWASLQALTKRKIPCLWRKSN